MITQESDWRNRLHQIIFESDTNAGRAFDVALLASILLSIFVVILDSVEALHLRFGVLFYNIEWFFTIVFTIEYIMRLMSISRPMKYALSLLGLIDLLAIIPMYLSILFIGTQSLLVFRILRLLRIFRIFKLTHFLSEMSFLNAALRSSAKKISIFMLFVFALVIIMGSVMYLVESGQNGFKSIPESIYWAIVTITTVGYGDISPVTSLGKFIASIIMLLGYGIIAVPTGIITSDMALLARKKNHTGQTCPGCGREGHDHNATFCKYCSERL